MRTAKHQHVRQLLVPCPQDHRKDNDWNENVTKMLCVWGDCQTALCLECAAAVTPRVNKHDYPYHAWYTIRLWCRKHVEEAE